MKKKHDKETEARHDQFHYCQKSQNIVIHVSWNPDSMFGFEEVNGYTLNFKYGDSDR